MPLGKLNSRMETGNEIEAHKFSVLEIEPKRLILCMCIPLLSGIHIHGLSPSVPSSSPSSSLLLLPPPLLLPLRPLLSSPPLPPPLPPLLPPPPPLLSSPPSPPPSPPPPSSSSPLLPPPPPLLPPSSSSPLLPPPLLPRVTSVASDLFYIHRHSLALLQVAWHPTQPGSLCLLTSDDTLRVYRLADPSVPLLTLPLSDSPPARCVEHHNNQPKYSPDSSNIQSYWTATQTIFVYRTPCSHDRKFITCLFIKPSDITGYWTVCLIGNTTKWFYECV